MNARADVRNQEKFGYMGFVILQWQEITRNADVLTVEGLNKRLCRGLALCNDLGVFQQQRFDV